MIVSICGTPGAGKTTAVGRLSGKGWIILDLSDRLRSSGLFEEDEKSGELEVDIDLAREYLAGSLGKDGSNIIIDGHLSYLAPWDLCIVMRLHPSIIGNRLKQRGYPSSKIRENVEAEAVGTVLVEAIEERDRNKGRIVLEIDCTGLGEEECSMKILDLIEASDGKKLNDHMRYRPGSIDWLEVMEEWY
jgi:adenylate kinase